MIADRRTVRDGAVPDGYALAEVQRYARIGMADGAVLDIAAGADTQRLAVATQHAVEPDAHIGAQGHIADAIDELGYVPRSNIPRQQSTGFVGIVVEKLPTLLTGDLFYADVTNGIQREAERLGYSIAVSVISEPTEVLPRLVAENAVIGLLALGGGDITDELLQLILKRDMPLVTVDNQSELQPVNSVVVDNYRGAYAATRHLIELGHRRIAIIQGPRKYKSLTERYHGHLNAMIDAGFAIDRELISPPLSSGLPNKGNREMKALLALDAPPTAVFAVSDRTALGAIQAIEQAGLQAPRDISIVGFDDMPPDVYPAPALTTVTSERLAMGHIAMQRLHQLIKNQDAVPINIVMPCQLVIRDSSGEPRKAD